MSRIEHQLIMVVDDEPGFRILTGAMLERGGFMVLEAADAVAALTMLDRATPDLIITDVMMPGVDGIEFCRRVRARSETVQTPVIMLSARGNPEIVELGFDVGATDYLVKPILHDDLIAKVRQLLGMTQQDA